MPKLIQNEVQKTRTTDHRAQQPVATVCGHPSVNKVVQEDNPSMVVCTCKGCGHSWTENS